MSLREWFFRRAMARAVAKRAPRRIPLTGERLMQRDYFSATLSGLPEGDVLVDALTRDEVVGRAWVAIPGDPQGQGEYSKDVTIPVTRAAAAQVHYTYYLRQHEYNESDSATLWLRLLGGSYRRDARKEEARQGRFNRQSLERRKRMDLLQWLIDEAVAAARDRTSAYRSALEFLTHQHGKRWMRHPAALQTLHYTTLLLDSLVSEQLVKADNGKGYCADPAALAAIEAYATDERRHNDSERTQRRLYCVAIAAGFAAFVQAFAAIWPLVAPEKAAESAPLPPTAAAPVQASGQPAGVRK
ncbi:hypothetical protein [Burkholderia stagnalis]|uniref:hypothetical protein n=1 Tax=Burkholderia stagnalis TaxID=1503054 RepID=UPI000F5BE964|nr:hypothetical protein [Burkholderia stagnalis]RQP98863.1 hypothetical protein DF164_31145 [Burkholderia stagnalis]RQY64915.1 hypothetical protein DF110_30670 [Burkholderia stagnalis]